MDETVHHQLQWHHCQDRSTSAAAQTGATARHDAGDAVEIAFMVLLRAGWSRRAARSTRAPARLGVHEGELG